MSDDPVERDYSFLYEEDDGCPYCASFLNSGDAHNDGCLFAAAQAVYDEWTNEHTVVTTIEALGASLIGAFVRDTVERFGPALHEMGDE